MEPARTDQTTDDLHVYKAQLSKYKEVLVFLYDFFTWPSPSGGYPVVLLVTALFFGHWYWDMGFVSTLAIILLGLSVLDYIVTQDDTKRFIPRVHNLERKYNLLCGNFKKLAEKAAELRGFMIKFKTQRPRAYAGIAWGTLAILAYTGAVIHNTVLLYSITLPIALLPGLVHHGILQRQFGKFFKELRIIINMKLVQEKKDECN